MKKLELLLILFGLSLLVSCANGGTGGGGGPVSVSLTPNSNPVLVGVTFTQQFTANVSGASNQSVTWSVSGSGCSGASCGAVDASHNGTIFDSRFDWYPAVHSASESSDQRYLERDRNRLQWLCLRNGG